MNADLLTQQRANKAKELLQDMLDDWKRQHKNMNHLSAARAIVAASSGGFRHSAPEEFAQWGTIDGNAQRFFVPWDYLGAKAVRDATLAVASSGGFLASPKTRPLDLPLIGSGLAQAGANFIINVQADTLVPKMVTKPPFGWFPESVSLTTDSTMALGQTMATLKRGGIDLKVSHQLTTQAQDFPATIDRLLIQLGNDAIDLGGLNGSGVSGQPLGLVNNSSITATSGASMNMVGLATMEENAVANDANDGALTWFASPDVRRILRQRELTAGSGSIWLGSELLGHRAIVTSKMPAASLLVGDFSNVDVLLFGGGVEVLVNPYANFQAGLLTFQLSVQMDLVLHYPASFSKSITIS